MFRLPLLYTREFPVIMCEIWGKAYKNFLGVETKTFPKNVFVFKNGLVEAYRNKAVHEELNLILLGKIHKDRHFIKEFSREYYAKFQELEAMWRKPFLEKHELKIFAEKMTVFWHSVYASYYIPTCQEFSEEDRTEMLYFRKKFADAAYQANKIILASLQHCYPNLGELSHYLKFEELAKEIDAKVLKERSVKEFVMMDDELINEKEFDVLKEKYSFELEDEEEPSEVEEITGQVACQGIAKGRVRLVNKLSEVNLLREGEILVSTMTIPDFLPAMKKAAAFVTDEGGITCHAAIVAREFNKPCIIGTKIATKALKNDDEVEVDAIKGIVRKISI